MNNSNSITIRAGQGTLSFLVNKDNTHSFHPYPVKSGMSLSANLREAFKEEPFLNQAIEKATLMVTSPVILIPKEDFTDSTDGSLESIYSYVLTGHKGEAKIATEIPELEAVAVYAVNKDLQMVVSDNSMDVEIRNIMIPVWKHLYNRYYQMGQRRKMFAYFHDKSVDICSFEQRRLRYANTFDAQHAHDALYYLLFSWKQLGMNQQEDNLFIVGELPHCEWLMTRLKAYLKHVNVINPNADLNRSALSQIEGMPFDMML